MTQMRKWSILTAVAVLIVFAAGWFMMVKPQKAKATDLRTQATTQEQANQLLQTQILTLQDEEKSLPAKQAALRKFTTQVPDNAAEPTIIRNLVAAANGAGVDLVSMTPGTASPVVAPIATTPAAGTSDAPATSGTTSTTPGTTTSLGATAAPGLVQLPLSIGITGTYPNIESFFQSLETLPRALLVSSWSMCPLKVDSSGGGATSSGGASCTPPTLSSATTDLPANMLGGTLSATVFYSPPAGTATPGATSLTGSTTTPSAGTTTPSTTTTTPPVTPSTAATPATTAGSTPPAS